MSDFSSPLVVDEENENSGCESESDTGKNQNEKQPKTRKKRKSQQRDPVAMTSKQNQIHTDDDETESQLNYEESPVEPATFTSPVSLQYQDKMRRRLQFFFMNPVEKWQAKRR